MEQVKHVRFHPSIPKRYTYVLEFKERIPSKKWYTDPTQCAQQGLSYGTAKYGEEKLLNVHVMENDKIIESWKK